MTKIPDKLFFKIGEVSRIVGVEPYILRYWESEFHILKPQKSKTKQRIYQKKDIELLLRIKSLLYDERYTIQGAKKKIADLLSAKREQKSGPFSEPKAAATENEGPAEKDELYEELRALKKEKEALQQELTQTQTDNKRLHQVKETSEKRAMLIEKTLAGKIDELTMNQKETDGLKAQSTKHQSLLKERGESLSEVSERCAALTQELSFTATQLNQEREKAGELANKVSSLSQLLAKYEKRFLEKDHEINKLHQTISENKDVLIQIRAEKQNLQMILVNVNRSLKDIYKHFSVKR